MQGIKNKKTLNRIELFSFVFSITLTILLAALCFYQPGSYDEAYKIIIFAIVANVISWAAFLFFGIKTKKQHKKEPFTDSIFRLDSYEDYCMMRPNGYYATVKNLEKKIEELTEELTKELSENKIALWSLKAGLTCKDGEHLGEVTPRSNKPNN